jgi:uncharacterized protein (TIGR02217 family)
LQTIYDYWTGSNNETSAAGPMILTPFCCAWNWDARPFPTFPLSTGAWGDTGNWPSGNWLNGKGPYVAIPAPDTAPGPGSHPTFPTLSGQGWSVHYKPRFSTRTAAKASGRETRTSRVSAPLWDIELTFGVLRNAAAFGELQQVLAFVAGRAGSGAPFLFAPPGSLGVYASAALGLGDGSTTAFIVTRSIGGATERVQAMIGTPIVYANGVVVSSATYALSILPATITFSVAPAAAVVLTIDFAAAHLARFSDDVEGLENFMSGLWQVAALRIETVRS